MECSLPSSSAHGIRQVRMIEWVATPSSRGILLTQGLNLGLLHGRQIVYHLSHQGRSHQVELLKSPRTESPQSWL